MTMSFSGLLSVGYSDQCVSDWGVREAGGPRRWEREGRIQARRGPSGQRYFDESDIRKVLQPGFDERSRKTVV